MALAPNAAVADGILIAEVCRCGKEKLAGRPFCFDCFCELLPSLQMVLWKRMRAGGMAEYEEACQWIDRQEQARG